MMEVFAGFLSHTDHHIGRLLDFLRETGELDNTLVMVVSDNGASAEGGPTGTTNETQFFNNAPEPLEDSVARIDELGGPTTFNHYPWGWTWAGNTPFRRWKRETYRGGSCDPFLVHWPAGIQARGEVRSQYAHIIDMVPTVLDALGIEPPATIRGVTQAPIHGVSFAHTLRRRRTRRPGTAPSTSRCSATAPSTTTDGGPSAPGRARRSPRPASPSARRSRPQVLSDLDANSWELYHVAEDFAENHDLADQHRDKLIALIAQWYVEAGKYGVLPIDGSAVERLMTERPQITKDRTSYTFWPGTQALPFAVAPRVLNRPHSITADVEIPTGGAEGVLLCQGANTGGFSFYVQDGRLHYAHNYVGRAIYRASSRGPGARGPARAALRVRAHRQAGHRPGQGRAGTGAALRRRRPGRPDRHAGHDPDHVQPRRP